MVAGICREAMKLGSASKTEGDSQRPNRLQPAAAAAIVSRRG